MLKYIPNIQDIQDIKDIKDITNVFYINLTSRPDRKEHVELQFKNIGLHAERFDAIVPSNGNGALGCSMSHLACLKMAQERKWTHVMIVEDDISFLKPAQFVSQLNAFLQAHKTWDVLLLGGNNFPPFRPVDSTCIRVSKCLTTTGYIVKEHYYTELIENIEKGIQKLLTYPHLYHLYAIDKFWFSLQRKHGWFLLLRGFVIQRPDYSDIEQKQVNYTRTMINIDKNGLLKNQNQNRKQSQNQINQQLQNAKKPFLMEYVK